MTQTLSQNKEELAKADQALRSMAGRVNTIYYPFDSNDFYINLFSVYSQF